MTTSTADETMSDETTAPAPKRHYFGPGFSMTVGPFHVVTDAEGYADLTGIPLLPELMVHETVPPVAAEEPVEAAPVEEVPAKKGKAAKAEATTAPVEEA